MPVGLTVLYLIFATYLSEFWKICKNESFITNEDARYTRLISIEMIIIPAHLHDTIVPNGQYDGQYGTKGPYDSLQPVSLIRLFQKSFPVILVTLSRVLDL